MRKHEEIHYKYKSVYFLQIFPLWYFKYFILFVKNVLYWWLFKLHSF